ncbi:MAG: hypothetical protein ACTSSI_12935 [Candidatus Helarchaeota archaeon]
MMAFTIGRIVKSKRAISKIFKINPIIPTIVKLNPIVKEIEITLVFLSSDMGSNFKHKDPGMKKTNIIPKIVFRMING